MAIILCFVGPFCSFLTSLGPLFLVGPRHLSSTLVFGQPGPVDPARHPLRQISNLKVTKYPKTFDRTDDL